MGRQWLLNSRGLDSGDGRYGISRLADVLVFLKASLRTIPRDWTAYMLLLVRRRPRNVRVLIFGQGRTGSTLLEDLLCSTDLFARHGELLGKRASRVRYPVAFLKGSARRRQSKNFVCHVKPDHLTIYRERAGARPVDVKTFLQSIVSDGFKIIYIRRSNRLAQFLSERVAQARGRYHKRDDQPETQRVIVDRQQLVRFAAWRKERDVDEASALNGLDFIEVEYERDLENASLHQPTVDRILHQLSVEKRPVRTSLRKVNERPWREIVENYEEFVAWATELGLVDGIDKAKGLDTELSARP